MDLSNLPPEQIQQLIGLLQSLLPAGEETAAIKKSVAKKGEHKIKPKIRTSKKKDTNRFSQMPEMNMHKEDTIIDRKLMKNPPTPRRSAFKPIEVRCRVCGRTESVDPSIIESLDRYKCNKCSASAG